MKRSREEFWVGDTIMMIIILLIITSMMIIFSSLSIIMIPVTIIIFVVIHVNSVKKLAENGAEQSKTTKIFKC